MTPDLPDFRPMISPSGSLDLTWGPLAVPATRGALIIALRDIAPDLADEFWRGQLDTDLIRIPIDIESGGTIAPVPRGRPIHVALILYDEQGAVVPAPTVQENRRLVPPITLLPERPIHHEAQPGRDVPLIFVDDQGSALEVLAAQVRGQMGSGLPHTVPPAHIEPCGFGSRQRWTLTRLSWTPPGDCALSLVVRREFITAQEVQGWRGGPPSDGRPLPPDTCGLIDGMTPQETTAFYVVLAETSGWQPLPLAPVPPPFEVPGHMVALGDASGCLLRGARERLDRLEVGPLEGTAVGPLLDLLDASLSTLPETTPEILSLRDEVRSRGETGML